MGRRGQLNAKEILVLARRLISNPGHWCKDSMAKKKASGRFVGCSVADWEACQWCATGAIDASIPSDAWVPHIEGRREAWEIMGNVCSMDNMVEFNDHPETKHEDVLDVFDQAIARLSRGER